MIFRPSGIDTEYRVKPNGELDLDDISEVESDHIESIVDRVFELCDELDLSDITREHARTLALEATVDTPVVTRTPEAIAAGAVYLATVLVNERTTQKEVASVSDVSVMTIRNAYHDILEAGDQKILNQHSSSQESEQEDSDTTADKQDRSSSWRSKILRLVRRVTGQ